MTTEDAGANAARPASFRKKRIARRDARRLETKSRGRHSAGMNAQPDDQAEPLAPPLSPLSNPPPQAGEGRVGVGAPPPAENPAIPPRVPPPRPREIGGPKGPEPTRYGDWEVGGRCTDF